MPITKRQFELGINEQIEIWMNRLYKFLSLNRTLAYSREEIIAQVKPIQRDVPHPSPEFDVAMERLVTIGAVESRTVGHVTYYGLGHEVNTQTWEIKRPARRGASLMERG